MDEAEIGLAGVDRVQHHAFGASQVGQCSQFLRAAQCISAADIAIDDLNSGGVKGRTIEICGRLLQDARNFTAELLRGITDIKTGNAFARLAQLIAGIESGVSPARTDRIDDCIKSDSHGLFLLQNLVKAAEISKGSDAIAGPHGDDIGMITLSAVILRKLFHQFPGMVVKDGGIADDDFRTCQFIQKVVALIGFTGFVAAQQQAAFQ